MSFLENTCCEYFLPVLACFVLLLLPFDEHKLLILMQSNLSIFSFMVSALPVQSYIFDYLPALLLFFMVRLIPSKCPVLSALYF